MREGRGRKERGGRFLFQWKKSRISPPKEEGGGKGRSLRRRKGRKGRRRFRFPSPRGGRLSNPLLEERGRRGRKEGCVKDFLSLIKKGRREEIHHLHLLREGREKAKRGGEEEKFFFGGRERGRILFCGGERGEKRRERPLLLVREGERGKCFLRHREGKKGDGKDPAISISQGGGEEGTEELRGRSALLFLQRKPFLKSHPFRKKENSRILAGREGVSLPRGRGKENLGGSRGEGLNRPDEKALPKGDPLSWGKGEKKKPLLRLFSVRREELLTGQRRGTEERKVVCIFPSSKEDVLSKGQHRRRA